MPNIYIYKKVTPQNGNYEDTAMDNVLISEVLMYADQHRHTSPKDAIIKVLASHFADEPINVAKAMLISKYGDLVDPERRKNRKDSHNRTEKMKVCEDIIDTLFDLDDQVDVVCVAREWKRLPKCAPEEVSDLSIAEMVAQHSAKFKVYDEAISEMKAQLLQLLDQRPTLTQPLMSEVVAQGVAKEQPLNEYITGRFSRSSYRW